MKTLEDFQIDKKVAQGKISYNFCAGPCILPRAVLDKCAEDMIDYKGTK